jgi:hypothetical protein
LITLDEADNKVLLTETFISELKKLTEGKGIKYNTKWGQVELSFENASFFITSNDIDGFKKLPKVD